MTIVELNEGELTFSHFIFHTLKYKQFIEEAFCCKYEILSVQENEQVKLILPIVKIKNKLFGNKMISSAYIEYGGFAGDEKYVPELINYLTEKYKDEYDYLEIRGGLENFDSVLSSQLQKENLYKRFVLKLESKETIWKNIQKSKRKAIKKALDCIEVKELSFENINELYHLYCRNMRSFGSPPYSKQYFLSFYHNLVKNKLGKMLGSFYNGKLVSALVGFCYQDRVHILIAVSDQKFQEFRPNDAMHWKFIEWAIDNNFKWFDFGRVREDSGQFEYKQKWGPELKELPSYFLLWKTKEVPIVDPHSGKNKFLVKLWKLMPLWVTKLVGMRLRKGLGI